MTRLTPTTALALCRVLFPAFLLWLALASLQPAVAQTTVPPVLVPAQQLTPIAAEIYPTAGSAPRSVGFGSAIAIQHDTAMISMTGYLDNAGRVALFKREASGHWLHDGSIDPASTPGVYGFGLGIVLRDDYALILSTTANYLYRKIHDQWTLLDLAPGVCCFAPNGETLEPPFVFVTNKVNRIGPQGKLQQTQTLVGDDPTFADAFGNEVAVSDGTLVISATSDNENRGALYTFEERQGVWVKTQKVVANDGVAGDELGTDVAISGDVMVAAAGGKDYNYVNPSCNNEPTSGVIYVFARVRGIWTQQQEIANPCLFGFQFVALDHDWLAIKDSGFAFTGQAPGAHIYRRENLPRSSKVTFVRYGDISTNGGAYESGAVLHGSQLFSQNTNQYATPPEVVNVYDLLRAAHRDAP